MTINTPIYLSIYINDHNNNKKELGTNVRISECYKKSLACSKSHIFLKTVLTYHEGLVFTTEVYMTRVRQRTQAERQLS